MGTIDDGAIKPETMTDLPPPPPTPGTSVPVVDPEAQANDSATSVVRRWRREGVLEKSALVLRAVAALFSALSVIVMASNKHGDWRDFDKYEEYRYLLAIGLLGLVYSMGQVLRHTHRFSTGKDIFSQQNSAYVDFTGDQILAYLLISSASAAVPITNRMREGADNIFTDASAAAISMAFLAFFALAASALISGYKLSRQSYI